MTELLANTLGPWTYGDFLTAILIIFTGIVLRFIVTGIIAKKVDEFTGKTENEADDIAAKAVISPLGNVAIIVALYFAFRTLASNQPEFLDLSASIFKAVMTAVIASVIFKIIDAISIIFIGLASKSESSFDDQIVPLLRKTAKTFVGVMAFIMVMQNLGFSVTGMITGLGIGGLAFALAAKDTIANLFGSVTILIDRPFRIGDVITAGSVSGTVEEIGLRSTRIRTFEKTIISIPNSEMANATVENKSERTLRRVAMQVGVTYDTSSAQIKEVVAGLKSMFTNHDGIDSDSFVVFFTNFGDSSLDIEFKYFTFATGYDDHMAIREEINIELMDMLEKMNVGIAFPSQTVYLERE
jgi:MscS family membrane protein